MVSFTAKGRRAWTAGAALAALGACVVLLSLNTGSMSIPPLSVLRTLLGFGSPDENLVLFEYRLPRILVTAMAGIGLGISGAILQGLSRNALADPGILGLNAGAGFGLMIFVSFFASMKGPVSLLIPLFAFGGAVLSAGLILLLAYDRRLGMTPIRLILTGIAVAAGFSALTLFLSLQLDEDTYAFASRWLAGSVWGRAPEHAAALLPWIAVFVPYTLLQARALNAFSLGDEVAAGIGLPVNRQRILLLLAAVALSSASVAMAGGIGFLGLLAPQLARRLAGNSHQHLLPLAGLIGMTVLTAADTAGRTLFLPSSIPAGVVVAAVGAPYFLYLLTRTK
ncbi:FecCD family ABC transporter permease [Paenibacillus sp. S-38]|uniref:FecCD family ABC transporter permease n=1 Tax=Paenibacillus sp. S-38 TaxID=3416710 RepID=UPI003CF0AFEF